MDDRIYQLERAGLCDIRICDALQALFNALDNVAARDGILPLILQPKITF